MKNVDFLTLKYKLNVQSLFAHMFLRNMAWNMYTDEKLTVLATAIYFDIKGAKTNNINMKKYFKL